MDTTRAVAKSHHRERPRRADRTRTIETRHTEVIEPNENEIQIDLDGPRAVATFNAQATFLASFGIGAEWLMSIVPSRSEKRGRLHVTLKVGPFPQYGPVMDERILVAVLLGSDLKRETMNYIRVTQSAPYPICFFRKKNVNRKQWFWQKFGPIPPKFSGMKRAI